ncbi:GDSL family lipase [Flavobacterium rivuli WB 3.3-2 = DSM 21788]|uniref:GDSL family lipase n=1 Tax=Flavobacterium rivuli WB 3.3-2 = DSM 21788 TaxID=1121895 RepID=A0A0A2MAG2_9FLAO|nr:SGNH/GDSL hydrolase family protein [Flavobacterium rivuli]KGO88626.1 GDSL family lipase [Flavobacterium rivuli WB 3.3-2 = DSM 21788]
MIIHQKLALVFIAVSLTCISWFTVLPPAKSIFAVKGRTEVLANGEVVLIASASSVTFGFKGTKCTLKLEAKDKTAHHNYVAVEVDGQYYSREKIMPTGTTVFINVPGKSHTITIYKATEAVNGTVIFTGAEGDLFKIAEKPKKKIEFIGDSITCGMGNDTIAIPCGKGEWYDQHNAYYSYAAVTARALNVDFVLSSVSGIGMYRNWNDEHDKEAIMPDVYENLYLNKDTTKPYAFGFNQDITCIALGTNDFSKGDGKKSRLPFNEDTYVSNYVNFIQTVYKHAPDTRIILLDSPMVTGENAATFAKCLNKVKDAVNAQKHHKPVTIFTFSAITPHGCGFHPEIEDDKLMALQLAPYLKKVLNEK